MLNKKRAQETPAYTETPMSETFSKALKSRANWADKRSIAGNPAKGQNPEFIRTVQYPYKDEFLDVVYWMRQIIGLILGLSWGILSMKGIIGIILFFAINTVVVYIYANSYQQVDEEEFGGVSELLKEGLMTSFATFLISWIILYSALYFN